MSATDPDRFRARYDDLLASTGMGTAAELAARFDIDLELALLPQARRRGTGQPKASADD